MRGAARPLALAFLLVLALTAPPYLIAHFAPPAGKAFVGAFYYPSDFYNYLSYAQQAEAGAYVFDNKVLLKENPPALVNLEWLLVGRLSALLGGHLVLAYRVFGVVAALGFLAMAQRWLFRLGLSPAESLAGLLLVATGGGLGGFFFELANRPLLRCLDLYAGLFPFLGLLANPHFVAGTSLLLAGLLAYETACSPRGHALAFVIASALALVRPYDFVLLVLVRGVCVVLREPPRRWASGLAPLAALLPVTAYLYWLFYVNPSFAFYATTPYGFPGRIPLLLALGPAAILGAIALGSHSLPGRYREAPLPLLVWAGLGFLVIAVRPVHFSLQFLVGIGFPLLALGALALRRLPTAGAILVVAAFSTSCLVAVKYVLSPNPMFVTARENLEIVAALRTVCRPGDVVFAPPEVGLFAYGLTPCRAFASHPIGPEYARRLELIQAFGEAPARERLGILDDSSITYLVLPGNPGPVPEAWLGPEAPFRRVASPPGDGGGLSLYQRVSGEVR